MDLREYLFRKRLKISEFARIVDYSANYIDKIVLGAHFPSKKLCRIITQATEGSVTEKDLRKNFDEIQKEKKAGKAL